MSDSVLTKIRNLVQDDVGGRGLRTDPNENLVTACAGDFMASCHSLAETRAAAVAVVTGFLIPHAEPPSGETDGPLGALFLARALAPIGIRVVLVTDQFCIQALDAGLAACGLKDGVGLMTVPAGDGSDPAVAHGFWRVYGARFGALTHLMALERVGPSHTQESIRLQPAASAETVSLFLREVPEDRHDRCHTMRGRDITASMGPAHLLFETCAAHFPGSTTIGIGDGGNEIGMGKIPWEIIRRNIPGGATVACRVPTDHLIVCGISNWGAYGLAAGVRLLRGHACDGDLCDIARERDLLRIMVEQGPLVDGVTGKPTISVDGLPFERYAEPLRRLAQIAIA